MISSTPHVPNHPLIEREVRSINRAIDIIDSRRPAPGVGTMRRANMTGTSVSVPDARVGPADFIGVLVTVGPDGTADFTDQRYWVRSITFGLADGADGPGDPVSMFIDDGAVSSWLVASNLGEMLTGSHQLTPIASPSDMTTPLSGIATVVIVRRAACGGWVFDALPGVATRHGIITAATAINGGIRWSYTITLGRWDMTSSGSTGGTWTADTDETTYTAFNSAEDMNTFTSGTGAIGTGNTNVTQSDGTVNGGSCKMVSLPVGGYVVVVPRGVDSSGVAYWTIVNFSNSAQ